MPSPKRMVLPANTGEETTGSFSKGGAFDQARLALSPAASSARTLPELNAPRAEMQMTLLAAIGEPTKLSLVLILAQITRGFAGPAWPSTLPVRAPLPR